MPPDPALLHRRLAEVAPRVVVPVAALAEDSPQVEVDQAEDRAHRGERVVGVAIAKSSSRWTFRPIRLQRRRCLRA